MTRHRVSIAHLMGVVLVASLGMVALRNASPVWAGVMFLLTTGVLGLAVVAIFCRGRAERTTWLGFAIFGYGYLGLAFWPDSFDLPLLPELPTTSLLATIRSHLDLPEEIYRGPGVTDSSMPLPFPATSFAKVGHCLCTLGAALLGGILAHLLVPSLPPEPRATAMLLEEPSPNRGRRWIAGLILLIVVVMISLIVARSRATIENWTGSAILLTSGMLGITALGAIGSRGRRRMAWLGATLFGTGYLLMTFFSETSDPWSPRLTTNRFLEAIRQGIASQGIDSEKARIEKALDQRVPMQFSQPTSLKDFLTWLRAVTAEADGRPIPIYVDPFGLLEAEQSMDSKIAIELEGVPLRASLKKVLNQLTLRYSVKDGILTIESDASDDRPPSEDPFLVLVQCILTWLAAALGALAAFVVSDPREASSA